MAGPRTRASGKLDITDPRETNFVSGGVGTTGTSYDLQMEFAHLQVINDGSDSIFVCVRGRDGATIPDATSGYEEVKPGEDIKYDKPQGEIKGRRYIGLVANSSTQNFRIFAWQ
jgi:hypothetical protein